MAIPMEEFYLTQAQKTALEWPHGMVLLAIRTLSTLGTLSTPNSAAIPLDCFLKIASARDPETL